MFGDNNGVETSTTLYKTVEFVAESSALPTKYEFTKPDGTTVTITNNLKVYDPETTDSTSLTTLETGEKYLLTFPIETSNVKEIEISANTFPGTYYVTGDTFARSYTTGNDEYFQFIIPKAKVQSENTITLEAEGDPSVFNMNLRVMRPADGGAMMKLVQYTISEATETADIMG